MTDSCLFPFTPNRPLDLIGLKIEIFFKYVMTTWVREHPVR